MYLSQASQEDLRLSPRQLEELFANSKLSEDPFETFDPAAIDEVLGESDFLDRFDKGYDNRLDFLALRLLDKISSPGAYYEDLPESDYCDDYGIDTSEQIPYPLRVLDEDEEDSNGLPNLRLVDKNSDDEDIIIPGEEDNSFEPDEDSENCDKDSRFRKAA